MFAAFHVTTTDALPTAPTTFVGASGTVIGVTGPDAEDAGELPNALVATTVNVYCWPFVRPVTTQVSAPEVVQALPPGEAVTRYPVTGRPLSSAAFQLTEAELAPLTPTMLVGAAGAEAGAVGVVHADRAE